MGKYDDVLEILRAARDFAMNLQDGTVDPGDLTPIELAFDKIRELGEEEVQEWLDDPSNLGKLDDALFILMFVEMILRRKNR